MGKVFSWEEIGTGKVPRIKNIELVVSLIKKNLDSMPEIIGAAICGSVLNDEMNIRNDVDVVLIYREGSQIEVMKQLQKITAIAEKIFVTVEFIPVNEKIAKTYNHSIDYGFWAHLSHSSRLGGVIKKNPNEILLTCDSNLKSETLSYMARKRSNLEKKWCKINNTSFDRLAYLEKILAEPIYSARKVLLCFDKNSLNKGDGKKIVISKYEKCFPGFGGSSLLSKLVIADRAYTKTLEKQMKILNKKEYNEALIAIEQHIPEVLLFLEMNNELVEQFK